MKQIELANKMITAIADQTEDPMDVISASCIVLSKAVCQLMKKENMTDVYNSYADKTSEILRKLANGSPSL